VRAFYGKKMLLFQAIITFAGILRGSVGVGLGVSRQRKSTRGNIVTSAFAPRNFKQTTVLKTTEIDTEIKITTEEIGIDAIKIKQRKTTRTIQQKYTSLNQNLL